MSLCVTLTMRRLSLWLLLAALGLTAAGAAAPLRIGVEFHAAPMSFIDDQGKPSGFTPELLAAMAATGLVEIEVVPNYWTNHLAALDAGKIDALANVVYRPNREPPMDYSVGHAWVHGVVYRRADHPPFHRIADFAGKKLGSLLGTVTYNHAADHPEWGATLHPYRGWDAALEATARGETDATLMLSPLSSQLTNQHNLKADFVDDIIYRYHFGVRPGDRATLARINEALAEVRHNGEFDRIYAKWIGPIEPHPIRLADLRPYFAPGAAVLLAVGLLIWWQRRMLDRQARSAEALRLSEERWKFAIEGSGDGLWDYDVPANQVLRSARWKEMLGYRADEIGTDMNEWRDRIHPDDLPAVMAAERALRDSHSGAIAVEHRLRCKDGSWKWVLIRGMVMSRDAEGRPLRIIGTHTDLTARKQAEEDRLVLGKLESTGVLAGGIAHDFNNLLTAILLNLELAQLNPADTVGLKRRLEGAQNAALSARNLTQQLITFARGDATLPRVVVISDLLRESVPLALTGSTVRGDIHIAPDLWPTEVDAGQIGQVIRNLVLNAREAMPDGGVVTLRAENTVVQTGDGRHLPAGSYLHITVSDHGEGIQPDVLPKIFDPYYSTKQRGPQRGMGLGLTICHAIIQKHNGAISVDSSPQAGTTFHVYLPAVPQAAVAAHTPAGDRDLSGQPSARILVMDDEPAVQHSVALALEQMGHTVELTDNGRSAVEQHALARAAGQPFDVVLLDLTVPGGMGGREAVKAMRVLEPGVKAVVMSGYANDEVLHDSAAHGFDAVLKKPFDLMALRDTLERLLKK